LLNGVIFAGRDATKRAAVQRCLSQER
jgi:hypothetical protein